MSSAMNLDQWNAQFEGDNKIELFRVADKGFTFELDVAYPVTVREAKVVRSSKGDVQLQLDLDVKDGDETIGSKREWLTLPKQESDLKLTRENAEKATQRRFDDMLRVLGAAFPKVYKSYAEKIEKPGQKPIFKDFDGNIIVGDAWATRATERQTKCVAFTDALHGRLDESIDELEGTSLWLVKASNKRDARYPYTNWYDAQPSKVPMFQGKAGDSLL